MILLTKQIPIQIRDAFCLCERAELDFNGAREYEMNIMTDQDTRKGDEIQSGGSNSQVNSRIPSASLHKTNIE